MDTMPVSRRWDVLAGFLWLAPVATHVRFVLLDERLPQDPNHAHLALPTLYRLLDSPSHWDQIPGAVGLHTTGWYNLAIAGALHLFGLRPGVMEAFHLLWVAVLVGGLLLLARRLWGSRGAVAAVGLISPVSYAIYLDARIGWIHVAEIALFLAVLAALVGDPALTRRRTAAIAIAAGMAGICIRPSGAIWGATLVPLLLSGGWSSDQRRRFAIRAGAVLTCWALALVPVLNEMRRYMDNKMMSRDRYEFLADPKVLWGGLMQDIGAVFGIVGLLGIVALVVRLPRDRWRPILLLAVWLVLPFGLYFWFHAGMPNFPAYVVAFALLGAGGLSRLPWPATLAPLLIWAPLFVAQWLPLNVARAVIDRPVLHRQGSLYTESPVNLVRPFRALEADDVLALLDATCADDTLCSIHVDRCLLQPNGVDPGVLELFLLGRQDVQLIPTWGTHVSGRQGDALASYRCKETDPNWRSRFEGFNLSRAEVLARFDYQPVWTRHLSPDCTFSWWTPGGILPVGMPDEGDGPETLEGPSQADWSVPGGGELQD